MKLNRDFKINNVGGENMLVNSSQRSVDLTTVYSLSESAAWLWKRIGDSEFDESTLVELLLGEYEVSPEVAEADVKELVGDWLEFGIAGN